MSASATPAQPEWLTATQVAARYGVTPQAVYKWIRAGRVRAEQTPGGSWRNRRAATSGCSSLPPTAC
jgi:excisionase family DNA binding protein